MHQPSFPATVRKPNSTLHDIHDSQQAAFVPDLRADFGCTAAQYEDSKERQVCCLVATVDISFVIRRHELGL